MQHYSSADTSINSTKLPTTFTRVQWTPGTRNFDLGGGKFDNATDFLKTLGVENVVYDPFNRSLQHNKRALKGAKDAFDTVTVNNVLNVIDSLDEINAVIRRANFVLKPRGIAYFKIYEGDKSGIGRPTKADCYQQNKVASWYLPLINSYFENTKRVGDIIIAINKRKLSYNPDFPLDIYGNTIVPR